MIKVADFGLAEAIYTRDKLLSLEERWYKCEASCM